MKIFEFFNITGDETEEEINLLCLAEQHLQVILKEQEEKKQIAKLNQFLG